MMSLLSSLTFIWELLIANFLLDISLYHGLHLRPPSLFASLSGVLSSLCTLSLGSPVMTRAATSMLTKLKLCSFSRDPDVWITAHGLLHSEILRVKPCKSVLPNSKEVCLVLAVWSMEVIAGAQAAIWAMMTMRIVKQQHGRCSVFDDCRGTSLELLYLLALSQGGKNNFYFV